MGSTRPGSLVAGGVTVAGVPAGPGSWQVVAVYPGDFSDDNAAASVSAMVRVLPAHATPWLTKNNGAGSPGLGAIHHAQIHSGAIRPLDPGVLAFGSTSPGDRTRYERPFQEENVRRINQVVMNSGPSQAVIDYIRGLYNGAVAQPGAVSQTDFVPPGWALQSGLYRQIVKRYCATCHLAGPANLSFTSWNNFLANKARIYQAVCVDRTMPHAEIPFREFGTKDTGPLYLPGLLAALLGYQSCP